MILPDNRDFEGIAFTNSTRNSVYVSDEEPTPGVREYSLTDGSRLQTFTTNYREFKEKVTETVNANDKAVNDKLVTTLKTALIHPVVQSLPFDLGTSIRPIRGSARAVLRMRRGRRMRWPYFRKSTLGSNPGGR